MPGYDIHKTARLLEWDLIAERLAALAASEPGRARCRALPFLDDANLIRLALEEVSEARNLLERGVEPQLGDVVEIDTIIKRARVGAALDGVDLLTVASILRASRRTKVLLEGEVDRLPKLAEHALLLPAEVVLEKEIQQRIERDGRVSDQASPELAQLRDRYRIIHAQIHATLDAMLMDPKYEDILQERVFSLRSGRFVLLVKHERRGTVEGIVHDISQTGQSLFIEPREVTDLNNRLRTAELEIDREIYRILLELTYKVQAIADKLERAVDALAELDVIFAKARYSMQLDAHPVETAKSGPIVLPKARHPLLVEQVEAVIPNDIMLDDVRTLVLSGPNAGGKTVFLKTLGLCALMLRAGLHLPCGADGRLPVFPRIFTVIGDEQSIAQHLSSFSSHVLNLKGIVDELVPNSLVLIDEMGEGTDPAQGVALSKAVLEHLHDRGARTVVTTHFTEMMAMAQVREGFANASMALDGETMTPTFQLIPGLPGRSGAFAIAERLGLAKAIVEQARQYATGSDTDLDQVISRLEAERAKWAAETQKAEQARRDAEGEREQQRRILDEVRAKKAKLVEQERERIVQEMSTARAAIKHAIRKLQEAPSFKAADEARDELERIEQAVEEILPAPAEEPPPVPLDPIEDWYALPEGATVFVRSLNDYGQVLEKPDAKGRVKLQVREKRVTLPAADCFLRPLPPERKAPVHVISVQPAARSEAEPRNEALELDLRGQTADEAITSTEAYLDQAARQRLRRVFIIHGHGTGVLKRAVRNYLAACPYAKSWRPGERGEGGDGVTVVELDL